MPKYATRPPIKSFRQNWPLPEYERLKAYSERTGWPMSELVIEAVGEFLDRQEARAGKAEADKSGGWDIASTRA